MSRLDGRWERKLDVSDIFHDEGIPLSRQAELIADRLEKVARKFPSRFASAAEVDELLNLAAQLRGADDDDTFNDIWSDIYDWADVNKRLWLNVWPCFSKKAPRAEIEKEA